MLARAFVQDPVQLDLVFVHHPRQQALHANHLPQALPLKLGYDTLPREAEVEDGKAACRIEAPPVEPGAFATEGIVALCDVTEGATTEAGRWRAGEAGRIGDRRQAVTPSAMARTAAMTRRYWPRSMRSSGFS